MIHGLGSQSLLLPHGWPTVFQVQWLFFIHRDRGQFSRIFSVDFNAIRNLNRYFICMHLKDMNLTGKSERLCGMPRPLLTRWHAKKFVLKYVPKFIVHDLPESQLTCLVNESTDAFTRNDILYSWNMGVGKGYIKHIKHNELALNTMNSIKYEQHTFSKKLHFF